MFLLLFCVVALNVQLVAADKDHSPWETRLVISASSEHPRGGWLLGFIDDGLAFELTGREETREDDLKLPAFPIEDRMMLATYRFLYSKDNDTLQLEVGSGRGKLREYNLWYLTATYNDKGGDVSLSKEEVKHSKWKFVPTGKHSGEVTYYYIRNVNDLGKSAWLTVGDVKKHYKGGIVTRKARLSFDEKQEFGIEDAESGR